MWVILKISSYDLSSIGKVVLSLLRTDYRFGLSIMKHVLNRKMPYIENVISKHIMGRDFYTRD